MTLSQYNEQSVLVFEDPGGEPLNQLVDGPMETTVFLRLAVAIAHAVGQLHKRHLIHKDLKPSNIVVARESGRVWLTGFGIASRLVRERQPLEPPEFIAWIKTSSVFLGAAKRTASSSRIAQHISGSGSRENGDEHRNQNGR
jgi:serine/threonine protein kinase